MLYYSGENFKVFTSINYEAVMMNQLKLLIALVLSFFVLGSAFAITVNVPPSNAAVTINVPSSWKPEETDKGVSCESPDGVTTIFFEVVASEKDMNALIDENIDWLVKDNGVKIKGQAKETKDFLVAGIKSSLISYAADSKEFGPAKVGFIFTPVGKKLLVSTYWITDKEFTDKHDAELTKVLNSVKPVK
jgi:hypothetical protein